MEQDPFSGSEFTTILVVSDIETSKHFYLNQLGAELYREYGGSSAVIRFLSNWILLVTGGEPTADKPETRFAPPTDTRSVSHSFTIRVADCQQSYDILHERGVSFVTPPYDWGQEVRCFFTDPDGHLFEISEYKSTDTE